MSDMSLLKEFCNVLKEQCSCASELIQLEEALSSAASKKDPETLDRLVKNSQPQLMNFRGLEMKRARLASSLGYTGKTASQILSSVNADEKALLAPVLSDLSDVLDRLQKSQESSDRIMQVRLSEIQEMLHNADVPVKQDRVHTNTLA